MTKPLGDIPRGVEVLVKKAAVDPAFREALLRERGGAAGRIGLALEPAEHAMLAAIPARQLGQVIAGTRVPLHTRAAFMGYAAAAMLATTSTFTACKSDEGGHSNLPEIPRIKSGETKKHKFSIPLFGKHNKKVALKGRVVDSSGKPLPGIMVRLDTYSDGSKQAPWLARSMYGIDKTTTDYNGLYEFEPKPPGKYRIMCKKRSDESVYFSTWYDTEPGATTIINITWGKGYPLLTLGSRPDISNDKEK